MKIIFIALLFIFYDGCVGSIDSDDDVVDGETNVRVERGADYGSNLGGPVAASGLPASIGPATGPPPEDITVSDPCGSSQCKYEMRAQQRLTKLDNGKSQMLGLVLCPTIEECQQECEKRGCNYVTLAGLTAPYMAHLYKIDDTMSSGDYASAEMFDSMAKTCSAANLKRHRRAPLRLFQNPPKPASQEILKPIKTGDTENQNLKPNNDNRKIIKNNLTPKPKPNSHENRPTTTKGPQNQQQRQLTTTRQPPVQKNYTRTSNWTRSQNRTDPCSRSENRTNYNHSESRSGSGSGSGSRSWDGRQWKSDNRSHYERSDNCSSSHTRVENRTKTENHTNTQWKSENRTRSENHTNTQWKSENRTNTQWKTENRTKVGPGPGPAPKTQTVDFEESKSPKPLIPGPKPLNPAPAPAPNPNSKPFSRTGIPHVDAFNEHYKRVYQSEEDKEKRTKDFQDNVNLMDDTNKKTKKPDDAKCGINNFADEDRQTFPKKFGGAKVEPQQDPVEIAQSIELPSNVKTKQKLDLRQLNLVPPIRYQGSCGACYAFASADVISMQNAIERRGNSNSPSSDDVPPLSPQYLIDCSPPGAGLGCDGGRPIKVMEGVAADSSGGIPHEGCQKYQGTPSGSCPSSSCCQRKKIQKAKMLDISGPKEKDLMAALLNAGPVLAIVNINEIWQFYNGSGVIKSHQCNPDERIHAVSIVGHDFSGSTPHYIVKNSWSKSWGIDGYALLEAGTNACGVAKNVITTCVRNCQTTMKDTKSIFTRNNLPE